MSRVELVGLVDLGHPLVKLGEKIDWALFEEPLGRTFDGKTEAPGIKTRLMVALDYLKYQSKLSDEAVVTRRVENAYWQQFRSRQLIEHEMPIDVLCMTRWRKRQGEAGAGSIFRRRPIRALR
jgi:IS5 family transposase